jgi:NAD(P)-dependent dehydrogenase (short-subunit alcohol dehydrogenase family)
MRCAGLLNLASLDAESVASFDTDTPLGRAGRPNEVAPALLFLACDDSSCFSGQVLHATGGVVINA